MPAERVFWSYEKQAEENPTPNEEQVVDDAAAADTGGGNGGFTYSGTGKDIAQKASKLKLGGKFKAFGAVGFSVAALIIMVVFFSAGNLIPAGISARLSEETDMQYADAVESKFIIFQAAMKGVTETGETTGKGGDLPDNVVEILRAKGVLVGVPDASAEGGFREVNTLDTGWLYLKIDDEVISADQFISAVHSNVKLYNAIEAATYSRAAYYYDSSAQEVFKEIGTNRNNYTSDSEFDEVMEDKVGSGSGINVWGATSGEQGAESKPEEGSNDCSTVTVTTDTGTGSGGSGTESYESCSKTNTVKTIWRSTSEKADNNSGSGAEEFIDATIEKTKDSSQAAATQNSADMLKVADSISKEQRSSLFFLTFMENISKMMAGDGNESKINEAMNYLYEEQTSSVIDINTGQPITTTGTALDSPSLYAILTGDEYNASKSKNYSSDRVLKMVEDKKGWGSITDAAMRGTVTTTNSDIKGEVGRFLWDPSYEGEVSVLYSTSEILNSSLVDNSYETIKGINAGEMLVEGAINVGKELANASGGTAGDADAVVSYLKLNSEILALDAASDRMNRSPFDITSKNTFLGSIVYNMAIGLRYSESGSILSNMVSFIKTTSSAIDSLLPMAHAEEVSSYLTSYGDCETIGKIGAVGSPQCVEIAVFDTDTLTDPLNDPNYRNFVSGNTNGSSVDKDSELAKFIDSSKRKSPIGITDGDILDKIMDTSGTCESGGDNIDEVLKGEDGSKECDAGEESSEGWLGGIKKIWQKIINLFKKVINSLSKSIAKLLKFSKADDEDKRRSNGAWYANTGENSDNWNGTNGGVGYKWAQRYVSLNRAMESLRQYAVNYDGRVAYNIPGFEWDENPVIAYIHESWADDTEIAEVVDDLDIELTDEEKAELEELLSYLDEYPELWELVEAELANYDL